MAAFAGLEEEAGALDSAEGEDVVTGAEDGFDAGEGSAADALRGFALKQKLDGAGVEPKVDVGVGCESFVVEAGEVGLGTPAGEVGFEVCELGEREFHIAPDGG